MQSGQQQRESLNEEARRREYAERGELQRRDLLGNPLDHPARKLAQATRKRDSRRSLAWLLFSAFILFPVAFVLFAAGLMLCFTIIGIPPGLLLMLMGFGVANIAVGGVVYMWLKELRNG